MLVKPDSYRWLDPAPLGDLKRVSRVPFSLHQKSGELCIPVDISETPPKPYKPDSGFTEIHRQYGLSPRIVEVAKRNVAEYKCREKKRSSKPYTGDNEPRPCLVDIMNSSVFPKVSKGYDGHNLLITTVVEYLHSGYTKDQVLQLLRKKQGYDEKQSSKFVDYIASKYSPRKCVTIEEYGGCVSNTCPNAKNKTLDVIAR